MIYIAKLQLERVEFDVVGSYYAEYKKDLISKLSRFGQIEIAIDQFTSTLLTDQELNSVYKLESRPDRVVISRRAVL